MSTEDPPNDKKDPTGKPETIISGKITVEHLANAFDNIVNAINKQKDKKHQEDENADTISKNQVAAQQQTNRISNRAFIASIFVFGVTACIFIWNILGVNAAFDITYLFIYFIKHGYFTDH